MRAKALLMVLFAGLAFSGIAYAEELTEVPPDTPEYFLVRYGFFVPKKERKSIEELFKPLNKIDDAYKNELKKFDKQLKDADEKYRKELKRLAENNRPEAEMGVLTAEYRAKREGINAQRQVVIDKRDAEKLPFRSQLEPLIAQFWASRDPDPATPENEFKQVIDERIQDIAEERFFTGVDTTGLMFRNNEGFRGDMARVYLLYGLPAEMGVIESNSSFVDLMLWMYMDEEGAPLYAFLFYERFDSGGYKVFYQEQYKMDPCAAIIELTKFNTYRQYNRASNQACPTEIQLAYHQLQMAIPTKGNLQGYHFAWAVFNFSRDPTLTVGQALEAPVSAKASAERSGARVAGDAPKLEPAEGMEYRLSGCQSCKSMIPADLQLEYGQQPLILFRTQDIDWEVRGEEASYTLNARIVFENGPDVRVFEKSFVITSQVQYVTNPSDDRLAQRLLDDEELASLPPGTYRVSVYVFNVLTNKYAAWERTYIKP